VGDFDVGGFGDRLAGIRVFVYLFGNGVAVVADGQAGG